jgi:hypothetical protein
MMKEDLYFVAIDFNINQDLDQAISQVKNYFSGIVVLVPFHLSEHQIYDDKIRIYGVFEEGTPFLVNDEFQALPSNLEVRILVSQNRKYIYYILDLVCFTVINLFSKMVLNRMFKDWDPLYQYLLFVRTYKRGVRQLHEEEQKKLDRIASASS